MAIYHQTLTLYKEEIQKTKGAFTRVPQGDQCGWINQSEPCKQFLSTEV